MPSDIEVLNEVLEEPPRPPLPISSRAERKLLRRLQKAATLLRKRKLSDSEYAAIAIDTGLRLQGEVSEESIPDGYDVGIFHFPLRTWKLLADQRNLSAEEGVARFGPYQTAVPRLAAATEATGRRQQNDEFSLRWGPAAQEVLDRAQMKLSRWNRFRLRIEKRLERKRRFFPISSELEHTALVAIVSAIIGAAIALLFGAA